MIKILVPVLSVLFFQANIYFVNVLINVSMSIAVAQAHHMYGLRSNISGNICYLDEQTILFPSGNQLVRFNLDFKQQKFIPGSDKAQGKLQELCRNMMYATVCCWFLARAENVVGN